MRLNVSVITILLGLLLALCVGCSSITDEQRAIALVRREVPLSGEISAKKLGGGFGPSVPILVSSGAQKYVVKTCGEDEVDNSKIASDGGYGPKVVFADSVQGILIYEWASGKKILFYDTKSDQFPVPLAHLLRKIHHGKEFASDYDEAARLRKLGL